MTTKTVESRIEALEAILSGTDASGQTVEQRLEALEAAADIGSGAARVDELETRVGKVVDFVVKFLTQVGEVYPGAGDDLIALQALDAPAVIAATAAKSAAASAKSAAVSAAAAVASISSK